VTFTANFKEEKAVGRLTEIIALRCGVCAAQARQIRTAAVLHDVGKLKIPKSVLYKPGSLTPEEFEVIKTHTTLGAEMLKSIQGGLGEMTRQTALYHHEHWDGGGYWGRFSDELPFYVPITSIADVYVAPVSARSYKPGREREAALAYIKNQAGAQFNPALVELFLPLARNDCCARAIFERGELFAGRY
jgi:putative two-component system response regulator